MSIILQGHSPVLELAWWSAGLPFGYVEKIDYDYAFDDNRDYICVSHEKWCYGSLIVCTKLNNTLYVVSERNLNVLFEWPSSSILPI